MGENIKILYVEDTEIWASIVKQILEPKGFIVQVASNGNKALEIFMNYSPDMVLLDLEMPGPNGWELIRKFKQVKEWIPVVLYSTYYNAEKVSDAFGLGAEDFLPKTCQPIELAERLRAYYIRAISKKQKADIFRISGQVVFNPYTGVLMIGGRKEILKQNEAKLLDLLCQKINQEADKKYLCEGIWGKGMYNDIKCNALKIYVTNLRKYLAEIPSLKISNKRWGGYCLIHYPEDK